MRTDVIKTIKNTLEQTKNITVLSLNVEDNILFGVYINDVKDSLSFLSLSKSHFETTIDNINIQFFELGSVLHSIYFHGALKYIDILYPDYDLIEPLDHYITLCDFVLENIPFNVAKLKYINAVSKNFTYEKDIDKVLMLTKIASDFNLMLLFDDDFENFTYVKEIKNNNDFIKACNQLNHFKQKLQNKNFSKISEAHIHRIDDMYTNLQILHIKV